MRKSLLYSWHTKRFKEKKIKFFSFSSQNGRFSTFLKKKEIASFAFKEEALIHQSTKRHKSIMSSSSAACTLGVRTRAQKRRIGERDVWDLIVNNDDICFKHILPRLNATDVKFLYEVNSETRKLIKRSSRESDLKKKFKVEEMSSISTLEFAWEHKSLWSGYLYDERSFCERVAETNKLELLEWARKEKKCEWDKDDSCGRI